MAHGFGVNQAVSGAVTINHAGYQMTDLRIKPRYLNCAILLNTTSG